MSAEDGDLLRLAMPEDLDGLVALASACVADMRGAGIEQWDEVYPGALLFARDIEASAQWVLVDAEKIAGAFALDRRLDPQWAGLAWSRPDEGAAAVHRLMVHPRLRGRGLAGRLMGRAEQLARKSGAHSLRLDAFSANPSALRVYEKRGYRRTGELMFRKGLFFGFEKVF